MSAKSSSSSEASSEDLQSIAPPPELLARIGGSEPSGEAAAFEKVSCVGEGAFGAVWLVRRRSDAVHFALKEVLRSRLAASEENVRRMWDERRALYAVTEARQSSSATSEGKEETVSPVLIGAVTSFTSPDSLSLVMDLVEGAPISEHLRSSGCLAQTAARWYAAEVAGALSWLHRAGWLYRDLKAEQAVSSGQQPPCRPAMS